MSHVHGSMPVTLVYFAPSGAPVSAGRDGNVCTYAVRATSANNDFSAVAASQSPQEGPLAASIADNALLALAERGPSLYADLANGTADAGSEPLPASRGSRLQLLTCIAVEAVPDVTAPTLDATTASTHGSGERLVCGFQACTQPSCEAQHVSTVVSYSPDET